MPRHVASTPARFALPLRGAATLAVMVLCVAAFVAFRALFAVQAESVPLRSAPAEAAATAGATAAASTAPPSAAPASAEAGTARLTVHVTGAVASPGVYELPAGARVDDAIRAAGGWREDGDEPALNLAQPLQDGQQVYAPIVGQQPPAAGGAVTDGGGATAVGMVNLNSADAGQLETLPGIGPALAGRIVEWRAQHGPFSSLADLDDVPGIGAGILEQIRGKAEV